MKKTTLCASLLALMTFTAAAQAASWVYVSNADSGTLTRYQLDKTRQKLLPDGRLEHLPSAMSSVLAPDKQHLYLMLRSKPYRVATLKVAADGQLTPQSETPLPESMAYLSLDKQGRFLLGASYGGDLFSINHIAAGGDVETAPVQVVPTGKRAHAVLVSPDNRYLYVSQLGSDQLLQYRFTPASGKVVPNSPPFVNIEKEAATGPRHFVFAPQAAQNGNRYLYVLNEMGGTITTLKRQDDGTLQQVASTASVDPAVAKNMQRGEARPTVGELPPSAKPRIWQADIHLTPDGRFLYASERTSSTLAAFAVSPQDGSLRFIGSVKTEQQPRGFIIDNSGRFLIASGEKSQQLSLYSIDPQSGRLTLRQQVPTDRGANWITLNE